MQCSTQRGLRIGQVEGGLLSRPGVTGDVGKWASQPDLSGEDRAGLEEGRIGMPCTAA